MQIAIQSRGFALTDALREYAERRVRFALARADGRAWHGNTCVPAKLTLAPAVRAIFRSTASTQ